MDTPLDRLTSPAPVAPSPPDLASPSVGVATADGVSPGAAGGASGAGDPLARYTAATAPDGWLTATGWLDLAAALDTAARQAADGGGPIRWSTLGWVEKLADRAADCRQHAARLTRGAA